MSGSSGQGTAAVARDTSTFLSATDDQNISALLCGTAWSGSNISFSFPDAAAEYGTAQGNGAGQYSDPAPFNGFSQFTLQEIGETLRAFGLIASYTNLTFSQITESTTTHATVRLANSTSPATSYAYNPSNSAVGGDVFLGPSAAHPIMGNYASGAALIHEIGHALGLVHGQGDFDKNNNLLNPYGVMNPNQLDIEYSLMNYPSYVGGPNLVTAGTLPQTYMMYDIAAFQYMYGANFGQVGQNNTYTWSTLTGEEFINGVSQGTPVDNHIFATVWTAGANSTYDLSGFTADQVDDMNPGGWMLFSPAQRADLDVTAPGTHVAQGDIYNALEFNGDRRSLIDNLFTGSGNDTIIGNGADNFIKSGAGSDTINAGGGANTITGGSGADKFVIDASLLPSGFDDIKDYDQGNSGSFATSEGDQIDLSALLSTAYNKGAGAAVTSLVRSVEDPGGLFAAVQIYTGGPISSWTTVAELFGVTTTEQINVILDATLPAGSSVSTTGELLEFTGVVDNNWDGHLTDKDSGALIHTNWTGDLVPSPNDDLVIAHFQSVILDQPLDELGHAHTYDSLGIEAGSSLAIGGTALTLDNSAGNSGIALTNQGTIADTYKLVVDGNIHNGGLIALQSNGPNYFNFSFLMLGGTDVTLDGGGSIVLRSGSNNANEITGTSASATTLHNVDNTISGIGSIGPGAVHPNVEPHFALNLDNQVAGTIDAGAGNSLLVSTPTITNAGTLEATAGGALTLRGNNITQTGVGVILASGVGSHVDLSGATVGGGLLSTIGGGVINVGAGTTSVLDGSGPFGAVTNAGYVLISNGIPLTLQGAIHNTGTIALQSNGPNYFNFSFLFLGGTGITLDGGGSIVLQSGGNNADEITGASASPTTLHNVDNTISGAGSIGPGAVHPNVEPHHALNLDNQVAGTIEAGTGNSLLVSTPTITNAGTIRATAGGALTLRGSATQTGVGVILASGAGSHVDLSGATVIGGLLSTVGGGTINAVANTTNVLDGSTAYGAVTNAGALFVGGGSPLLLQGTIHNAGTITVQTNGGNYNNFSLLQIGTAGITLDGTGSVVLQATGNNANQITGVSSAFATTLHNAGIISGVGAIGQGALHPNVEPHDLLFFDNRATGTVSAAGGNLILGSLTAANAGTLEASAASGLILQGGATIEQTGGGGIRATGANSHVDLNGVTLLGGLLSSDGGGVINALAGTTNVLDGSTAYGAVTNAGGLFVGGGAPLLLQGTIHNNGTITVQTNGGNYFNFSLLQIGTAGVVLDGTGSVVLQTIGNNANQITGVSSAFATTLHNAGTISGVGAIGQGALHPNVEPHDKLVFDNQIGGTVNADSAGNPLTIDTGATITNDGALAADGGMLVVDDPVAGAGHVLITGDGSVRINSLFQQNVTFSGAGTLVLPEAAAAQGGHIGHIAGWSGSDIVDVPGVAFSSNYRVLIGGSGGALSLFVVDSANSNALIAQMNLTGSYSSRNFTLSASQDGLAITEHAAGPVPVPSGLALSPASDSGVPGDNITNVATPLITGTGEAGDTVILDDGATAIGSATVAGNGAWSITPAQALAIGAHSLTAQQTDLTGNVSPASASLNLTIVSPMPQQSPVVLDDFGWAQGWGSPNNPRMTADVDRNGATDYAGFGFQAVFVNYGGTFSDGQGHNGPGFTNANVAVNDFGTAEGYTADVQRGVAFTGNPLGDTIYGQGFVGVYWYAPTGATPQTDQSGKPYSVLQYQTSASLYGDFGSQQGWTPHNGFQILKNGGSDAYASILGFGTAGIVVGPQAFAPGAMAASSYTITGAMGNSSGWDQQVDIRTFTDVNGNTIDLNHDGSADFVGMGPQGLVYAFGNSGGPGGAYGLGPLQTAHIGAGNSADLGEAQGWSNAVTLRYIVSDPQTGFDDILAFGAPGVFVSMGQDPATHGGEAFGQLYLAMPDFGSDQGWSVQQTPRIVGDVNGDGIPDIVGFGANSTFAAIGSRDATGHLQFALDMTRTINDFGFNEAWSGTDPQTVRTLGDVAGNGHSELILSGAFNTQVWAFN